MDEAPQKLLANQQANRNWWCHMHLSPTTENPGIEHELRPQHSHFVMITMKRSERSSVVQSEMVRVTGMERWKEGRWWREFLDERRTFFNKINISAKPKETERDALGVSFKDWVKASQEWWGGDWVDQSGLAEWHVSQYLRARKVSESSYQPIGSIAEANDAEETSVPPFDPVRDI
ncbi:uncharacterized protein LY89DRAFT_718857 [Mollisia scopiformis]|uniref:Uncharacterized protein n=1 Tax=Mollisia scopiformis TaxID=149040 RepID=A0A194XAL3_MOLSC|nr:uncharacterized protein LY89DRAFT_718857 [Mollisia scopiformis]KUJ17206.1 hypothetical protein LY89DRAFT_718857 [Mollisia scopiformis]